MNRASWDRESLDRVMKTSITRYEKISVKKDATFMLFPNLENKSPPEFSQ